jgi:alkylation response protein AidB-like acyl-CoA dehydrogenase
MTTTVSLDCIEAAHSLAPEIRARAAETEAARQVPADLARKLAEAGLYRMLQPAHYGGLEVDLRTFIEVIEIITCADGAVGWCLMKGATTNYFAAHLPEAGAQAIFGSTPDLISSGSFNPRGRAVPVAGGYRISGRWTWGSGCQHSDWMVGGCMVFEGEQPRMTPHGPELLAAFFPISAVQIIDTWQSVGMRGSGSHDFAVEDLFVPSEQTFAHLMAVPQVQSPLYVIPTPGLLPIGHGPIATGLLRAAIDAVSELATTKTPLMARGLLRDKETTQQQVAQAEATYHSARAFIHAASDELWAAAIAGQQHTPQQLAMLSLATTHATHTCVQAVNQMFTVGAGTSVFTTFGVERPFRDIHTAATHFLVTPDKYAAVGRTLLGVPPQGPQ